MQNKTTNILGLLEPEKISNGFVIILILCVIAILLQRISNTLMKGISLDPEIVGGFFQVIGTVYAILIGLIVYDATSRYSDAHENVVNESKALVSVFMLSKQVAAKETSNEIQSMTKDYVHEVVVNDWTCLENEVANIKARELIRDINMKAISLTPKTKNEEVIVPMLIEASMDVWRYRMSRFDISTHRLPNHEWMLLLYGAAITLACSFLYCLECQKAQGALTFLTSSIIFSSLYAILMFSEPYKGDFAVSKKPFEIAMDIIDGSYFNQGVLNN
mgnify:FL=1